MYVESVVPYFTTSGEQHSPRGWYLILAQDGMGELYGCLRKVALTQSGQFMLGTARIKGKSVTVSGSCGNDGMPLLVGQDMPIDCLTAFTRVPDRIAYNYWYVSDHASYAALSGWANKTLLHKGDR